VVVQSNFYLFRWVPLVVSHNHLSEFFQIRVNNCRWSLSIPNARAHGFWEMQGVYCLDHGIVPRWFWFGQHINNWEVIGARAIQNTWNGTHVVMSCCAIIYSLNNYPSNSTAVYKVVKNGFIINTKERWVHAEPCIGINLISFFFFFFFFCFVNYTQIESILF
jgi:hypothetical protein